MSQKKTGYMIRASTGCSCSTCKRERFLIFNFKDEDGLQTMEQAEGFAKDKRLRSQYSNTGIYDISTFQYEELPDGRKIIGNYISTDSDSCDGLYIEGYEAVFNMLENEAGKTLVTYGSYLK